MTVSTHGNFIVLPKRKTQAVTTITHLVTLSRHWANQSFPYPIMLTGWLASDNYQFSFLGLSRPGFKLVGSNPTARRTLTHFNPHSVLLFYVLEKPRDISGRVSTFDILHSLQLYNAARLEKPCYQHHHLTSNSVTLSSHCLITVCLFSYFMS